MRLRLDSTSRFPAARRSRGFCGLCSFSRRNGARSSTRNSVRNVDWKFRRSTVKYTVRRGSTSFVANEHRDCFFWWKAGLSRHARPRTGEAEKRTIQVAPSVYVHLKNHHFLQVRATCSKGVSLSLLPLQACQWEIGSSPRKRDIRSFHFSSIKIVARDDAYQRFSNDSPRNRFDAGVAFQRLVRADRGNEIGRIDFVRDTRKCKFPFDRRAGKGSVGNSNRTRRWSHPVPREWEAGSRRSITIDRRTPCALLSVGKTRWWWWWWWLGRRATPRLGRRGKRIRRWLRAELTRFFYYDTQLEPGRPCATV